MRGVAGPLCTYIFYFLVLFINCHTDPDFKWLTNSKTRVGHVDSKTVGVSTTFLPAPSVGGAGARPPASLSKRSRADPSNGRTNSGLGHLGGRAGANRVAKTRNHQRKLGQLMASSSLTAMPPSRSSRVKFNTTLVWNRKASNATRMRTRSSSTSRTNLRLSRRRQQKPNLHRPNCRAWKTRSASQSRRRTHLEQKGGARHGPDRHTAGELGQ